MVHFTKILLLLQKSVAFRDIAYNMYIQGEVTSNKTPITREYLQDHT